ncbi:hypothetical protein TYRP_018163 [Tyrophagus putrescentiae]|nr:hypothetical protein TYRP_018163 [Tyrophagus putrescentiae]
MNPAHKAYLYSLVRQSVEVADPTDTTSLQEQALHLAYLFLVILSPILLYFILMALVVLLCTGLLALAKRREQEREEREELELEQQQNFEPNEGWGVKLRRKLKAALSRNATLGMPAIAASADFRV